MPDMKMIRLAYETRMTAGTQDAEIKLYGEIVQDGPEWWKWSKEDKSANDFDKAITKLKEDGATNVLLRINSPGGIVMEAAAMRSILVAANFNSINIRIEGMCASAATILATIPGAHVTMATGAEYMIHNPWSFAMGDAALMERAAEHLRKNEATSREWYMARTGQSEEQIKEWMDKETWFSAKEAVQYGFADEIQDEGASDGKGVFTPAAACACVSSAMMNAMRQMYANIPDNIFVEDDKNDSNAAPVAGSASVNKSDKEGETMDIKDLTREQLQSENPELLNTIAANAVAAERQRIADIDALTISGYEEMAAKAKEDGTSAIDFQKMVVAAQKQKGKDFMSARTKETASAKAVESGAAESSNMSVSDEINAFAKDVAAYAKVSRNDAFDSMF